MKKALALGLMLLLVLTTSVFAQSSPKFGFLGWGPRAGMTVNPDQFHIGAHILIGSSASPVIFQPNIEIGFGDNVTLVTINGDVLYTFRSTSSLWRPALGGEIGFTSTSFKHGGSNSDLSLSILGQISKRLTNGNEILLEAKIGVADAPDFKATVGYTLF
jgi:hypothetical protein